MCTDVLIFSTVLPTDLMEAALDQLELPRYNCMYIGVDKMYSNPEGKLQINFDSISPSLKCMYDPKKTLICCTSAASKLSEVHRNQLLYVPSREVYEDNEIGWLFHLKFYLDYLMEFSLDWQYDVSYHLSSLLLN